jgi:hypothetical protein
MKNWRKIIVKGLILIVVFVLLLPQNSTYAATYYFTQNDWSGGATTTEAVHPDNREGWNYYSSTTLSGGSLVQTSDADFGVGSFNFTTVEGTGTAASVRLKTPPFRYRKPITISNNSTSSLTDYQILITLDTQSLISAGKMRNDCGDIRFTDSDGTTLLNYWLESGCNTNNTKIWVKVPSIPANSTKTIYVYYGNPNITSLSNGDNTFDFFDDFLGTSLDTNKWGSSGSVTVSSGIVNLDRAGIDVRLFSLNRIYTSKPFITEVKYQHPSVYRNRLYIATSQNGWSPTGYDYGIFDPSIYWNGFTGVSINSNTWYIIRWEDTSNNYIWRILDMNGNEIISRAHGSAIANTGYLSFAGTESDGSDFKLDWVRVRKYTSPEPTTSIGGEQGPPYSPSGTFTSSVLDTGLNSIFTTFNFNASTTQATIIKFQLRSGKSTSELLTKDFVGPDGTTNSYYTTSGTQIWSGHNGDRYIQYKAYLETTDTSQTPYLNDVTINYKYKLSELFLGAISKFFFQTSDNDFSAGSLNFTMIEGVGSMARVRLKGEPYFQYRKPITISNNSGSSLSDYQILVTLDTQSLISAGKMRNDCGDIRFTDSDGTTLLNYWLESGCNTNNTKIWVKVPSIPANSTKTIYVYYGNPNATSQSNGKNTMFIFEDFNTPPEGGLAGMATYDATNKWVNLGTGNTGYLYYSRVPSNPIGFYTKFYFWVGGGYTDAIWLGAYDSSYSGTQEDVVNGGYHFTFDEYQDRICFTKSITSNGNGITCASATNIDNAQWHLAEIYFWYDGSAARTKIYYDGNLMVNSSDTAVQSNVVSGVGQIIWGQRGVLSPATHIIGNGPLYMVKYTSPEPTTNIGTEEPYYSTSGTFTSSILDTGSNSIFTTFNFNALTTQVTTIKFQLRSGKSISELLTKDFVGPDGTTNSYYTTSGTQIWSGHNGDRYIQYKAYLETTDTSQTPYLNDVTINYYYYPSSGELISSPYDSSSDANIIAGISWDEETPAGTGVIVSLRSASSSSLLDSSPWFDFTSTTTGCTKNATTVTCSSSAIPSSLKDGVGDRFVQYKVTLISDGVNTPIFDNFSLTYVVNAPPEFNPNFGAQGISAVQVSDPQDLLWGRVKIQYSIRDPDTTQGSVTPGYVSPRFQYSLDNGATWNDITSTYLRDGDLANKAVQEVNYANYDAIWDVKAQIPNVFTNNLLLKVIINDNEAANNLAFKVATLTIDTKPPERGSPPFSINADKMPAELKISANDDNSIQMRIGLQPDLSDANWENYATSKTISLATDTTATVYYQFRDAYNNVTDIFSATIPEKPKAFIIQDTSNLYASPVKYSLYLDWQEIPEPTTSPFKQYNVLRSTDGVNFTQIGTIFNKNVSYFTDATVLPNTLYYYKVTAQDQHNNISFSSKIIRAMANGVQDYDEGGGGSLPPLPKIQFSINNSSGLENVTPVNIEIVLSTTTSENVSVNYAVTGGSATYGADYTITTGATGTITIPAGSTSTTLSLNIIDDNLREPDENIIITLSNPINADLGNNNTFIYTILDNEPRVRGVNIQSWSTEAVVSWATEEVGSSIVEYGTTTPPAEGAYNFSESKPELVLDHKIYLTNLTPSTTYYLRVKSVKADGQEIIDDNQGRGYSFTTNNGPVISNVQVADITDTSAKINWITDKPSNSTVHYSTSSDLSRVSRVSSNDLVTSHTITLINLKPLTTYYFKVESTDAENNTGISTNRGNYYSFTTLDDMTPPEISDVRVLLQTSKLLVITWQTNEPADGQIEYGTQQGVYSSSTEISPYLSTFHALTLSGLNPQTTYYFRIKSKDAKNNLGVSQEYTASTTAEEAKLIRETLYLGVSTEQYNQLKTEYEKTKEEAQKAKQESEKLKQELEKLQDKTPPEISNIEIKNVQPFSATVCFKTNEPAIGIVQYGEEKGKYTYSVSEDDYLTSHCLELKRLKMGTKYYLRIIAIDKMGNKSIKTTK